MLRILWNYQSEVSARAFWKRGCFQAPHGRLEPMIAAAELICRRLPKRRIMAPGEVSIQQLSCGVQHVVFS